MRELVSVLFALLPALFIAGWGRYLVRHLDDPAFPELHLKKIQRLGFALAIGLGLSFVASTQHAMSKFLLAVLAVTAADFPYRRKIFQETWSFFAYLTHGIRFWIAYLGVLTLLALLPEIVYHSGQRAMEWGLPVAVAIGVVLLVWNYFNAWTFPRILGSVPFEHSDLEPRFAAVLEKADCRPPKLWRSGPRGGNIVNAFALPSLHRPGVVFSTGLLEALGPRELTAVFAHEVGHLEHYTRWRLVRRQVALTLTVALLLVALFYFGRDSALARTLVWAWPIACLVMFTRAQAGNQGHEHESDLRAIELCGDPQALADGLAKIHLLTAMPRRWGAKDERRMSHPSLAQRLRAISEASGLETRHEAADGETRHEAGGLETRVEAGPLLVRAEGDPTRAVVLAADRLHWLSGLPAEAELDPETAHGLAGDARAIRYQDLADLRLEVGSFGARHLKATDREGRKMKMPLSADDVAAVKAGLERIDRHVLGTAPEAAPEIAETSGLGGQRLEAVLALFAAVAPPFTAPLALAALLVLIRPALVTLAAAGAVGVASAGLGWWWMPESWLVGTTTIKVTLAGQGIFGLLFLWQAVERHRARYPEPRWVAWMTLLTLGGFTALSAVGVALRFALPFPLLQLHRWARQSPGLVLLLIGTAAAFWSLRRWGTRLPALGLAAAAAAVVLLGTAAFRERWGGDPLRTMEPRLLIEDAVVEKVRSVPLDDWATNLVLSPSGERLAAGGWDVSSNLGDVEDGYGYGYGNPNLRFEVETDSGSVEISGDVIEFIDEDRVAVLDAHSEGMKLSSVSLSSVSQSSMAADGISLPLLMEPRLRVAGSRWQVTGTDWGEAGQGIIRLSGVFGEPDFERQSWRPEGGEQAFFSSLQVTSAGRVLAIGANAGMGDWSLLSFLTLLGGAHAVSSEVTTLGPEGQRRLLTTSMNLTCLEPEPDQLDFHCLASEAGSTQLWSIDPEAESVTPVGSLPGEYWQAYPLDDGRLLLSGFDESLALVDPATRRASKIGDQIDTGSPLASEGDGEEVPGGWLAEMIAAQAGAFLDFSTLAVRSGHLAVAVRTGETTRVDVYRLPPRSNR
ncbi:MAG: M48 family metalloprotease [bacterium]|nr:M48 family metalloprotease [bacterium]